MLEEQLTPLRVHGEKERACRKEMCRRFGERERERERETSVAREISRSRDSQRERRCRMWNMTEKDAPKESSREERGPCRVAPYGGRRPLVERTWLERDGISTRTGGASEKEGGWTAEREREAPWTERAEKEEVSGWETERRSARERSWICRRAWRGEGKAPGFWKSFILPARSAFQTLPNTGTLLYGSVSRVVDVRPSFHQ